MSNLPNWKLHGSEAKFILLNLCYCLDNMTGPLHSSNDMSRHASAHLMEEIVLLWELTVMSPYISTKEKLDVKLKLETLDKQVIDAAKKGR